MKGAYIQMADRFYELHVAGVTRKLPILNVNDKLAIAGFVILGDVELVEKAAAALVKRVPPETEIMVTAETKGIPLVHEMARLMGMPRYAIARKSVKAYMENPIIVEDRSITTKGNRSSFFKMRILPLFAAGRSSLWMMSSAQAAPSRPWKNLSKRRAAQ